MPAAVDGHGGGDEGLSFRIGEISRWEKECSVDQLLGMLFPFPFNSVFFEPLAASLDRPGKLIAVVPTREYGRSLPLRSTYGRQRHQPHAALPASPPEGSHEPQWFSTEFDQFSRFRSRHDGWLVGSCLS